MSEGDPSGFEAGRLGSRYGGRVEDGVPEVSLVPGRSCAGCTMCCKLPGVAALNKPPLQLCTHCKVGVGCRIYDQRPDECAEFFCAYMVNAKLSEAWKPSDCKMMISFEAPAKRVLVHVDPARSDAWRKEPFFSQIKAMAAQALRQQGHLIVWQGRDAIAVLPGSEVNLGPVKDETIMVTEKRSPLGVEYDVVLLAPDDPRLRG